MHSTKSELQLPVGDKPFWDTERWEEEASLTSISDSCVVSHSLRQSRDRWLFRTFPRFSSKARGNKAPDVVPPPHTIQTRGKCDLEVGPHIFTDTIIYEVHYLSQGPVPVTASNPVSQTNASPAGPHSYNQSSVTSQSSTPSVPATGTNPDIPEQENVSTPLISSLADVTSITPVLINRVNTAASANPILSNLLQLAAAGHASSDQLKTLGLLIQSLANMEEQPAATASIQQTPTAVNHQRTPPVKDFDLVLEFREAPTERWVFPRVLVYGERKSTTPSTNQDILLTTCIPFSVAKKSASDVSQQPSLETSTESPAQHVVALRLIEAPWAIWDTIYRWIGGEDKLRSNKTQIDGLIPPKRMFLGHQLPPGSLLAQLQIASAPAYTMKTLKHGPTAPPRSSRPKKTNTQRKQTENNIKDTVSDTNNTITKTARASQSKPSSPIRCVSCNQTDVPLILGGRFCRPCVDSGRWTANPALPPSLPQPAL